MDTSKVSFPFKKHIFVLCSLASLFMCLSGCSTGKKPDASGFITVFDGKTLNGWKGDPTYWRVEDGALVGQITPETLLKQNSFIIWQGDMPPNFELIVDYRITIAGNSGINYRSETLDGVPYALRGYQADLNGHNNHTGSTYEERRRTVIASQGEIVILPDLADAGDLSRYAKGNHWTARDVAGSLGTKQSLQDRINKDDWNEYRIVAKGNRLQHFVNGVLMSDVTDNDTVNQRFDGLLGVQVHVGPPMKIEYRNFRVRAID